MTGYKERKRYVEMNQEVKGNQEDFQRKKEDFKGIKKIFRGTNKKRSVGSIKLKISLQTLRM